MWRGHAGDNQRQRRPSEPGDEDCERGRSERTQGPTGMVRFVTITLTAGPHLRAELLGCHLRSNRPYANLGQRDLVVELLTLLGCGPVRTAYRRDQIARARTAADWLGGERRTFSLRSSLRVSCD